MADRVESFNFDVDSAANDEANYFNSTFKKIKNALLKTRPISNEMFMLFIHALNSDALSLKRLFLWNEGNQTLVTIQIFTVYLSF